MNDHQDWDTGLYGACGACGSIVLGDPLTGALVGSIFAMFVRRVVIPWGAAIVEAALERLRPPPPPPPPPAV